jgi:tRNA(Ile)-lysidine synthase
MVAARSLTAVLPFRYNLTVPGETISDEMGWVLTAEPVSRPSGDLARASLEAYLNPESLKGALYFRSWKAGDEMRPLGFSGHRKVADLMSETSLTEAARARLPIVCDMVGILWAPGVCVDERCRLEPGAKALKLAFRALRI